MREWSAMNSVAGVSCMCGVEASGKVLGNF